MPPFALAAAEPVEAPLQVTETELAVNVNGGGADRFNETDEVHPKKSVTVAVYNPAHKPVIVLAVAPLLQLKEYGLFPPVPSAVIWPMQIPLHVSDVEEIICAVTPGKLLICTSILVVQLLASVTVTG